MKILVATRGAALVVLSGSLVGLTLVLSGARLGSADLGPLRVETKGVNLTLLAYVAGLTWLVARYCSVNLRGQPRLTRFGALCAANAVALALMVLSGNLATLAVGWTLSGVAIAGLVSHSGSASAQRAGRLVLVWMLGASAVLWAAVITAGLVGLGLDGTDPTVALSSGSATVVAVLVLGAALVRSAMVPFHRWLPETAEAPSPVSGLLHAGIVNATGIVAVLQWPLLSAQPLVLAAIGVFGVATIGWCALEQRVRPDVKGKLAASTSAQMGWMAIQVGVGVPAAAMLHLMGHGAWKAWHFLRAGGAIARARREPLLRHAPSTAETLISGALAVLPVLLAVVVVASAFELAAAGAVLVCGLGLVAAGFIGREAALLERSSALLRRSIALVGGLVAAAYVAMATAWDHALSENAGLVHTSYWWSVPLAVVALAVAVLLALYVPRMNPDSSHPVATLAASTAVPPGTRLAAGRVTGQGFTETTAASVEHREPVMAEADVRGAVETAAKMIAPAWPLRSTVAANPLARLEFLEFDTAISLAERFHGGSLRPSLGKFIELFDDGTITERALESAAEAHHDLLGAARTAQNLAEFTRAQAIAEPHRVRGSAAKMQLAAPLAHANVWTGRAWRHAEDSHADLHGPWALWRASAAHGIYDVALRSRGAAEFVRSLPEEPAAAITELLARRRANGDAAFEAITELLAAGPGWASHATWRSQRCGTSGPLLELIALRMALAVLDGGAGLSSERQLAAETSDSGSHDAADDVLRQVWQQALDTSERDRLCAQLTVKPAPSRKVGAPAVQSVWCIDVRSERFRRHVEKAGGHETFGFAGFFGLLGRGYTPDGASFDQCPVIVSPTVAIDIQGPELSLVSAAVRVATRVSARPGVGFATAEAGGLAAFAAALAATVQPERWNDLARSATPSSHQGLTDVSLRELADAHQMLDVEQRADAAEGMLRAIGLTSGFAPTLMLVGHGSTTENNAYVSAYECGACGGNPGLLNAAAMAGVLNDPQVRAVLASRGIVLGSETRVLAAQHDTTTDQVSVVGFDELSQAHAEIIRPQLADATESVVAERSVLLPHQGRPAGLREVQARAADWAEPMPEWGLSGAMAIVVGPRGLTALADLGGRVFLHSYDRTQDADGTVIAALLNAPVVVSQWISSQYWFSTTAPGILGAGDKTTHNVVGDIGVTSGAHGDLRLGLPWQALFATDPTQPKTSATPGSLHVPSRHLVVLEADPSHVVTAIRDSATLHDLVSHQWMRLVVVDHGTLLELQPNLEWQQMLAGSLVAEGQR